MPIDSAWITAHKVPLAAAGAGVVGLLAWRAKSKSSSAANGTASNLYGYTVPTVNGVPTTVSGMSGFDSSQLDQYNQLAGAISSQNDSIDALQTQIAGLAASQVPPAPSSVSTGSGGGTVTGGSSTADGVPSGWKRIPNPSIGSQIAAAGVPWKTIGNAEYYDPAALVHIANPAQGSALTKQGFKAVTMNGAQFYNPLQKH